MLRSGSCTPKVTLSNTAPPRAALSVKITSSPVSLSENPRWMPAVPVSLSA